MMINRRLIIGGAIAAAFIPSVAVAAEKEKIYLKLTLRENRHFTPGECALCFTRVGARSSTEYPRYECRPTNAFYEDLMAVYDADENTLVKQLHYQHFDTKKYIFSNHLKFAGDTKTITMWKVR